MALRWTKPFIRELPLRRLWPDTDGSVLLETTLVVPVLMSLFLGLFEFSFYFYQQQLIEIGIRDAARYMARIPITSTATPIDTNPCDQVDTYASSPTHNSTYVQIAKNIATTGQGASGGTARVWGWAAANVTITCPSSAALASGTYADGTTTQTIISVTTTFADPTLGFLGYFGMTAPNLSFTHQERYIGPG